MLVEEIDALYVVYRNAIVKQHKTSNKVLPQILPPALGVNFPSRIILADARFDSLVTLLSCKESG